ncbi:type II secretion system secretin GspD [bacterium]|nr:type II secretion system secretin GspD [bacterium]
MKAWIMVILVFFVCQVTNAAPPTDLKAPLKLRPTIKKIKPFSPKSIEKKEKKKAKKRKEEREEEARKATGKNIVEPPSDGSEGLGTALKIDAPKAKPLKKNTKVKLYFPDTPLIDVIKWFALMTQRNFILADDRLGKKKVHMLSTKPVSLAEAYRTFLLLLSINSYSVTPRGKYIVIRPEKFVRTSAVPFYKDGKVPNLFTMVATILKFDHMAASDVDKMLKIFRSKGATSYVVDDKTLIMIDYAANIKRMQQIIKEVDVAHEANSVKLHFLPVDFVSASDAKKLITDVFKDFQKKGSRKKKTKTSAPMMGGIAKSRKAKKTAAALDEQASGLHENIYLHVVADDRSEQLLIMCSHDVYRIIVQIVKMVDKNIEGDGEIHVVKLQNAKAKDMVKTLSKVSKSKRKSGKNKKKGADVFEGEINISANESTNSLVIVSSFKDFKNLKRVIEKLDVRRKQVFVEAAILEVSVDDSLEYGNVFAAGGFAANIGGEQVPIFFGKALAPNANPGFISGILGPAIPGSDGIPGLGLGGGVPSLGLILNAAKEDANVNVLSTPHLMTTDNEEAEIIVGETIPFPTGNIINGVSGSQVTYKREDVALKLKIKPQINESGYMTLDINQEITELGKNTPYGYATTKRQAKTIINAENEQTIVIGGLMKTVITDTESKIPFLGDIPVLGALFKYKVKSEKKVNLLIIITPHIVEGKEDFARILNRKMKERKDFARKFYGSLEEYRGSTFMSKRRGALLALAKELAKAEFNEKIELERLHKQNVRRSLIVESDGTSKTVDPLEGEEEEIVPSLQDENLDDEDEL